MVALVACYGAICLLMFCLQGRLLYVTSVPPAWSPAQYGLSFEDWMLTTEDGITINAWYLPARQARGVLIVCHGNAGNIGYEIPFARMFVDRGWSCVLLEYRGYGRSGGSPSEQGTYLDAVAAFDAARKAAPELPIAVFGSSLGGAIAIELALRRKVAAVITEATFTSLPKLAQEMYRWLPVRWLTRFRYDSLSKMGRLTVPYLNIHSPGDRLVPYRHSAPLLAACRSRKEHLRTEGGHNDGGFQQNPEWVDAVVRFLEGAG